MKTIIFAMLALLSTAWTCSPLVAQNHLRTQQEQSDPEARKILVKLRDKYKTTRGLKMDYVLTIEGGDTKEIQQGKIFQKGDKFRVTNQGNEMISDGKTVWTYIKRQNEVQITDFEASPDEVMSPSQMMDFATIDKKYIYAITNQDAEADYIEFKPLSRDSEYSKMRMKVLKTKAEVEHIKIFMKDGSRYTLDIKKIEVSDVSDSQFAFDKTKYPGVRETDLRD